MKLQWRGLTELLNIITTNSVAEEETGHRDMPCMYTEDLSDQVKGTSVSHPCQVRCLEVIAKKYRGRNNTPQERFRLETQKKRAKKIIHSQNN